MGRMGDYFRRIPRVARIAALLALLGVAGLAADATRVPAVVEPYVTELFYVPVDGGTRAGGGWFFSPAEGRFVNRPKGL